MDRSGCLLWVSRNGSGHDPLVWGFDRRWEDAYREIYPLTPGFEEQVELCNLYPLLVHVVLFGGGYADDFLRCLRYYSGVKKTRTGRVFQFSQALCLRKADVNCVRAFATLFHFKRDIVVITDLVFRPVT